VVEDLMNIDTLAVALVNMAQADIPKEEGLSFSPDHVENIALMIKREVKKIKEKLGDLSIKSSAECELGAGDAPGLGHEGSTQTAPHESPRDDNPDPVCPHGPDSRNKKGPTDARSSVTGT
jgi:hypothetical protein